MRNISIKLISFTMSGSYTYTTKFTKFFFSSNISSELSIEIKIERRVWRYQKGNQRPYIEEEQTTQCAKEKVQKDKQRSTKHTHKTEDRVTRILLKPGGEVRC